MINSIILNNFKCFHHTKIDFSDITLLAGINGMGKSTVVQAILFVFQSSDHILSLNGELVHLGTAKDVLYESAQEDEICIQLNDFRFELKYVDANTSEFHLPENNNGISQIKNMTPIYYLNCERIGPRSSYEMSYNTVVKNKQIGIRGEYAIHFLSEFQDEPVNSALRHKDSKSLSLLSQLESWMGEICPGTNFKCFHHPEMDLVRFSIEFTGEKVRSRAFRPTNVGFGISYVLPIVLAGLTAKPGSLIIIENPEAHLHPKGQAKIGEFFALVAKTGVQIILETHSDHVLNSIRLAVKKGKLTPQDVAIHFFERIVENQRFYHKITSPTIAENGRLDQWPKDFFDQWDNALIDLV